MTPNPNDVRALALKVENNSYVNDKKDAAAHLRAYATLLEQEQQRDERVRKAFRCGIKDGKCQCPICRRDFEALLECFCDREIRLDALNADPIIPPNKRAALKRLLAAAAVLAEKELVKIPAPPASTGKERGE